MEKEFWIFCLDWVATNTPLLIDLLKALVPVLALFLTGYALHAVTRKAKRSKSE